MRRGLFKYIPGNYAVNFKPLFHELRCWDFLQLVTMLLLLFAGVLFIYTTGRPRRCGWFDAVATRYSCMINGVDKMAITKLDVLDTMKEIKVCIGYELDGKVIDYVPSDVEDLAKVKPVYESVPGWNCSTENVTCYADLPENAKKYLDHIAELVESEVAIVSVGPKREQTFEK